MAKPLNKQVILDKKFKELYGTQNKKNMQIPLLRFLFEQNFDVDNKGELFLKPESPLNYQKVGEKAKDAFNLTLPEKEARYAVNPLTQTYRGEVQKLSNRMKGRDASQIINDYKKLEGRYDQMGSYLTDPGAQKYVNSVNDKLLSPLKKQTQRTFKEKLLPELENEMIRSGTYGGLIHGKLAERGLRNLQEDFIDKASEIQGRSLQQSAQIYHADQDAAMNRLAMLNNLATQRKMQEEGEERKMAEMSNKVQNEEQNYLDNLWYQQRYNRQEPINRLGDFFNAISSDNFSSREPRMRGSPSQYQEDFRTTQMAKGGKVSLKKATKELQKKGRYGDTILAHINPQEAMLLKLAGGSGTINPDTGLPEFFLPFVLPFAGGALGMFGAGALGLGTLGTLLLSGLGSGLGGMIGSKDRRLGFGKAALLGASLPTMAGLAGAGLTGLGATTLGGGLTSLAGTGNLLASTAGAAGAAKEAAGMTFMDKLALGSTGLQGLTGAYTAYTQNQLANKQIDMQKQQIEEQKELIRKTLEREELDAKKRKELEEELRRLDDLEREKMLNYRIGNAPAPMFKGGYVQGKNSGVEDDIPMRVPHGSYVLDATTVSLIGDGNSEAGSQKISDFLEKKNGGTNKKQYLPSLFHISELRTGSKPKKSKMADILVSGGEYILMPEEVSLFSKDQTLDSGVSNLEKLRRNLKKQKKFGGNVGIPPRTRQLEAYI